METLTQTDTVEAVLPHFPGFYNSELDAHMDMEIEREMDETGEDYGTVEKRIEYARGRLAMASAWVDCFERETKLPVKFKELWSPREYNFQTDMVIVTLPIETMLEVLREVRGSDQLAETASDLFTPRSGFCPFYSADAEWWDARALADPAGFDSVECQTLLTAWLALKDHETDFSDDCRVYEAASQIWIA